MIQRGESSGRPAWIGTGRCELALAGHEPAFLARRLCQQRAYEPHCYGREGTPVNPGFFSRAFEFSEHYIEQKGVNLSFKLEGRGTCKTREYNTEEKTMK